MTKYVCKTEVKVFFESFQKFHYKNMYHLNQLGFVSPAAVAVPVLERAVAVDTI